MELCSCQGQVAKESSGGLTNEYGMRTSQWVDSSARLSPEPTAAQGGQGPSHLARATAKGSMSCRRGRQRAGWEGPDLGELVHDDVEAVPLHVQCLRLVCCLQNLERQVP